MGCQLIPAQASMCEAFSEGKCAIDTSRISRAFSTSGVAMGGLPWRTLAVLLAWFKLAYSAFYARSAATKNITYENRHFSRAG